VSAFSGVLASLAWSFFGFLALALTIDRHYRDVFGKTANLPGAARLRMVKWIGVFGLILSLVCVVLYKGWAVGATAWMGVLAVTAFSLMLLLSYKPGWALRALAGSLVLAFVALLAVLSS